MPPERTAPRPHERPRYRYVLFRLEHPPGPPRADFIAALRRVAGESAWLTRYDGAWGILRCLRGEETRVRAVVDERLATVGWPAASISTSGTIAALERRHPVLRRQKRRG
jgi:RNase P/RNase MRP subunit POP5